MAQPASNWKTRVQALLDAAKDVALQHYMDPGIAAALPQYQSLFRQYLQELRSAKEGAEAWWKALIDTEEQRTRDRAEAVLNVKERRPIGPVTEPKVIATIRKFWLLCAELNNQVAPNQRIPPQALILSWLLQAGHSDLAKFLSDLPYWPIGMDHNGNWV